MQDDLQISALEPQKKRKDRYNVYVDGEYTASLGAQACLKHGIRAGASISEAALRRAVLEDNTQFAFDSAITLLARKMRTQHELEQHMRSRAISPDAIEAALQKLADYGYVNDAEYAAEFVRGAIAGGRYGSKVAAHKLAQKGVADDIAETALSAFTSDIEADIAARLAQSLRRQYAGDPPQKRRQKIYAALQRRGFGYDVISTLLSEEEEP